MVALVDDRNDIPYNVCTGQIKPAENKGIQGARCKENEVHIEGARSNTTYYIYLLVR